MSKAIIRIERLVDVCGRATAWLGLLMMTIMLLIVLLRYFFNAGMIALQEAVVYLHAAFFMLGLAWTLQQDKHVRVDVFLQKFPPRGRAWVELLGGIFLLLPVCALILLSSWHYVGSSWQIFEGSREAGGLPGVFLLKTLIPLVAVLLLLQGLVLIWRSIVTIRKSE